MKLYNLVILLYTASTLWAQIEIPTSHNNYQVIQHQYYSLGYSETHEQAAWVAYELTAQELAGTAPRKDNFRADPMVSTGSAQLEDYRGSGYDRGHLAPAADMKVNALAMSESFYLSNMSPQQSGFNRYVWKELEAWVRNQAKYYTITGYNYYIVTGPILRAGLPTIGPNEVSVPEYYYKVIYNPSITGPQAGIAFLMKNEPSSLSPIHPTFVVSIDEIEELTGIDFFPSLDDALENTIEANKVLNIHPGGEVIEQKQSTTPNKRCQANTKSGTQCKRKAECGFEYCWQHNK